MVEPGTPALAGWRDVQPWVGGIAAIAVSLDWWWLVRSRRAALKHLQTQATSHVLHFIFGESLRAARLPWLWFLMASLQRPTVLTSWPAPVQFLVAYLAVDFVIYWWHRVLHDSSLGWASHSVHHTAGLFELSLGARLGVLQRALDDIIYLPLCLLGISPGLLIVAIEVNRLSQFWTHTERIGRLPIIDWWFNSPATHRVHHAMLPGGKRANFGSNLMIWDHLFGTYQAPNDERTYGVTGVPGVEGFLETQLQGFRALWKSTQARSPLELAVAIAYSLFAFAWFTTYAARYDASVFLWLCSVCNILMLFAVWSPGNGVLSVASLLGLGVYGVFAVDLVVHLVTGHAWLGVSDYLLEDGRPVLPRLLSLFHLWMPVLMIFLLARRGHQRSAWKIALPLSAGIILLGDWYTSAPGMLLTRETNLNFVHGFPSNGSLISTGSLLAWAFMCIVFIFPTHRLLSIAFPSRVTVS